MEFDFKQVLRSVGYVAFWHVHKVLKTSLLKYSMWVENMNTFIYVVRSSAVEGECQVEELLSRWDMITGVESSYRVRVIFRVLKLAFAVSS